MLGCGGRSGLLISMGGGLHGARQFDADDFTRTNLTRRRFNANMCNGVSGLKKGGGWVAGLGSGVEVGEVGDEKVGVGGLESGGLGGIAVKGLGRGGCGRGV